MKARLILYFFALMVIATVIIIIYTLPIETVATSIIALLISIHLAIITVIWGARIAAVGAVFAFLVFNYFFTQPYFAFSIQHVKDISILIMFLLVTILVSPFAMPIRFIPASDREMELLNILVRDWPRSSPRKLTAIQSKREWEILSRIIGSVLRHVEQARIGQTIETEVAKGLPLLFIDPAQIEYVLTSLINNISRYTVSNTSIYIGAWAEGEFIHIRVSSQSHQIAYEEIKDILDQLNPGISGARSLHSSPELSICQKIINAHDGLLWAENTPEGLAFHLALPLS